MKINYNNDIEIELNEKDLLFLMSCVSSCYGYLKSEDIEKRFNINITEFNKLTSRLLQFREKYNIDF